LLQNSNYSIKIRSSNSDEEYIVDDNENYSSDYDDDFDLEEESEISD
jgi:hypothetical protein